MKQIILETTVSEPSAERICHGKLVLVWGLYGVAMAVFWNLAGASRPAEAATWAFAVVTGPGLLLAVGEV